MKNLTSYPKFVKVRERKYPIDTDFRTAIECNMISEDITIGNVERTAAVLFKLFGEEALDHTEDWEDLIRLAKKYLLCGEEKQEEPEEPDMDYVQDMSYIITSFKSDYNIDLNEQNMHWWEFNDLMNGLSDSELGNCCVLNRVRGLRNLDTSQIQDQKELERINKAKERVSLKKKERELTNKEKENIDNFNKLLGLERE